MIEKGRLYREDDDPKPKPNVIPFQHKPGTPMYEWWKGLIKDNSEALTKLASVQDDFDFYHQILSNYYAPSELKGKSLLQLEEMLQLHIRQDGSLF